MRQKEIYSSNRTVPIVSQKQHDDNDNNNNQINSDHWRCYLDHRYSDVLNENKTSLLAKPDIILPLTKIKYDANDKICLYSHNARKYYVYLTVFTT